MAPKIIIIPPRNKTELIDLYLSQYTEKFIKNEINDIIRAYRPNFPMGVPVSCKRISDKEFLQFVKQHGEPTGYILSDEFKQKIKEL